MSTDASPGRTRARRNWAALAVGVLAALLLWFATSGEVPREVGEPVGTAASTDATAGADAAGRSRTRARAAASEEFAAPVPEPESSAPRPASSAWRFTVVADEDGAPIAGAVIAEVYQDAPRDVATTGSDGTCELAEVGTRLRASAPGRVALVQEVRPLKEREYVFRLVAAGVVRGRVDKPDGTPAADVGVRLLRGEDVFCEEATTGPDGRFEFRTWPFGACGYVDAGRPSLAQLRSGRARPGDDAPPPATSDTFRLSAERPAVDLVLRLGRRATLVLSAVGPDGAPAKGPVDFRVRTTRGGQTSRDASPQREILMDPGRMCVDAAGPAGISDAVVLTVRADERVERVLHLRSAASISGTVIGEGGRPAADAQISWREAPGSDAWSAVGSFLPQPPTDAEGRFVLDGVRPGRYVAEVRDGDRGRRFDVAAPAEGLVLRMDTFANIRFAVHGADGNELPRFARVIWAPGGDRRNARMQDVVPSGGVWTARVPSGPGIVRIELLGTLVVDREIDIVSDQTLDLGTVEVPRWRTLAGRVLLADGRPAPPLSNVIAFLDGDLGHLWAASAQIVSRDGRFEMRARDGEGLVLLAELPGHALAFTTIPRDGDVRDIELKAVRGGTVRVHVVRGGAPARDATWTCGPAPQGFARVEADGVAERRCVPGPVRVVVRAPGAADVVRDVVVTEGATTDVDVTLPE